MEEAVAIWQQIEACGSYLFNKSHATAYAVTSYIGGWLKANFPVAFYTVALEWADDKELMPIMSEMEACSNAKVVAPNINRSDISFYTDYEQNSIFWSLTRIKMLGTKAVDWIINERNKNGEFISINNFIDRIFKYKLKKYEYWDDPDNEEEATRCPVNARHVLNLILAGCFDSIEHAGSVIERFAIIEKAAEHLGFEIKEKDFPIELRSKHYFWKASNKSRFQVLGQSTTNEFTTTQQSRKASVAVPHTATFVTFSILIRTVKKWQLVLPLSRWKRKSSRVRKPVK